MAEGVPDKNTGGKGRQGKRGKKSQRAEFAPPSSDAQGPVSVSDMEVSEIQGIGAIKNGGMPPTSHSSLSAKTGASGMSPDSGPTQGKKKKKCRKSPKQRKKEKMARQAEGVTTQPNEPPDQKSRPLPDQRRQHRQVEGLESTADEASVAKNESPSCYLHHIETLMEIGTIQLDIHKREGREKVELTASRSATMIDWYGLLAGAGSGSLAGIADEDEAAASRSCSHNMAVGDASDIVEICIRCGKRM